MDPDAETYLREIRNSQERIEATLNNLVKNVSQEGVREELKTLHIKLELLRQQLVLVEQTLKK